MLNRVLAHSIQKIFRATPIHWLRRDPNAWICRNLPRRMIRLGTPEKEDAIARAAATTHELGPQTLWEGYKAVENYKFEVRDATRLPNQVRIDRELGQLMSHIVVTRKPRVVVEFGAAFGVSGMYWLAGLERIRSGVLLTFEPNTSWAAVARSNMAQISQRFDLTVGTFEANIAGKLADGASIDIAFIDAIHTSEFVFRQFELIVEHAASGAVILIDDIAFSPDMASCWTQLAHDPRARASAVVAHRLGIIELQR